MPRTIHLRPIQTGDACYLQDHHNRDGECLLTVTMSDDCASISAALSAIGEAIENEAHIPMPRFYAPNARGAASAAAWCAEQWQLAQADMPAAEDRDTDGDDSGRYLDCHILATWED